MHAGLSRYGVLLCAVFATGGPVAAEDKEPIVGTLQNIEGTVLIKRGEESVPAIEGQTVRRSQEVLVTEGAKALLVFNDGCDIDLDVSELYTIPGNSPCASLWWAAPAAAGVICGAAVLKKTKNSRKIAAAGLLVGGALITVGHNIENEDPELLAALESSQGEVLTREADGIARVVRPGTRLRAGSELIVKAGSRATVRFDDACTKAIDASNERPDNDKADKIFKIPHNSPCFRPGLWWASAAAATGLCIAAEDEDDVSSP